MTQLLETLRNRIVTSLYGRRLGLDKDEFIQGPKALRKANQTLTSGTTGTAIPNYGITGFSVTSGSASTASSVGTTEVGLSWAMDAPAEGVRKTLYIGGTTLSTAGVVVEFGTGVTAYGSSLGSTFTGLRMDGTGAWATLEGVSTSKWLLVGMSTSSSLASSN